jgi:hypothetical protein
MVPAARHCEASSRFGSIALTFGQGQRAGGVLDEPGDVGRNAGAAAEHVVQRGIAQRGLLGDRAGKAGAARIGLGRVACAVEGHRILGDAGVRVAVGDVDRWRAAREAAERAADLQAIRSAPADAEARQDDVAAVQRLLIGEAVAVGEELVQRGRRAHVVPFVAHAGDDGQCIRDVPRVLHAEHDVLVIEHCRGAVDVARGALRQVELVRAARVKIGDGVEVEGARRTLQEQVVDVDVGILRQEAQIVVADQQVGGELNVEILGVQRVGLAADVRAEADRTLAVRAARGIGAGDLAGRGEADVELAEFAAIGRGLPADVVAVADARFGGEHVRPARVQLRNARMHHLRQL